jgi:excisionase family DNA binding protein
MSHSLLTAHDVAELLGVPASWVYEQSRRGRIPTVTLGRYRRYRREAIDEWVRELEHELSGAGGHEIAMVRPATFIEERVA